MKEYFIRLFNYDGFANKLIAETIFSVGNPVKPVQLMAHLLAAQQIWLSRFNSKPIPGFTLFPDWKADSFIQLIDDNNRAWMSYLNGLTNADLEKSFTYKNLSGVELTDRLEDVLAHVINHGTHHRAQIGQLLKQLGVENLPVTDYIYYLRDKK